MQTQYPAVNAYLVAFDRQVKKILSNNLVGIYLFGSLSYGDFVPGRSDIDLLVVVKDAVSPSVFKQLGEMHQLLEQLFPAWVGRVECSYTPRSMFSSLTPPGERPYWGESEWYMATYGNEWIINNYLLQEHGITLFGPQFKSICPQVVLHDVQSACKLDLSKEWAPKLHDDAWLSNPHYQSYLVLNLCRILHTIMSGKVSSKTISANWVMNKYPEWKDLIKSALSWSYGQKLHVTEETKRFLSYVIDVVQNDDSLEL